MTSPTRRRLLRTAPALLVAGVAGCSTDETRDLATTVDRDGGEFALVHALDGDAVASTTIGVGSDGGSLTRLRTSTAVERDGFAIASLALTFGTVAEAPEGYVGTLPTDVAHTFGVESDRYEFGVEGLDRDTTLTVSFLLALADATDRTVGTRLRLTGPDGDTLRAEHTATVGGS